MNNAPWDTHHDAVQLAAAFRDKTLTPSELAERALAAAAKAPEAFICLTPERARREAAEATRRWRLGSPLSALDGIPIAWKDLFDLAATRTSAGSATRAAASPAITDATVVAQLQAAGLVSIGKTNLSEFAYSGLGLNPHFGTPAIFDRDGLAHAPGGSSSGSASAVARGIVPIAIATDTAGSIRIPAAFHGLIGYRSSSKRYSRRGVFPLAPSLDTLGPLCRSVRDAIALDRLLAPAAHPVPLIPLTRMTLRVDVEALHAPQVQPAVRQNLLATLARLRAAGARIDERPVAALHQAQAWLAERGWPGSAEALAQHRELLNSPLAEKMDPRVRSRLLAAEALPAELLPEFLQQRAGWQQQMRDELAGALLVTPTVAHVAPPLAALENDAERFARVNLATLRLTMPGSLLDMPGVALPTGQDDTGLATSLLLALPNGDDERLLSMALSIERRLTTQD
ncbi:amidase [Serratia marcescens]|uniref:amidase n=1 Tax=Serratia marcescens TaxID=615 RepID=UPI003F7E51AB